MNEFDFFIDTFNLIRSHLTKAKYRLKNKKFTRLEKNILQAFIYYRGNKIKKTFELLEDISPDKSSLYAGFHAYLLGLALNQSGEFQKGEQKLKFAYDKFKQDNLSMAFYPASVLVINLANQNKLSCAKKYLDASEALCKNNPWASQIVLMEARLAYLDLSDQTNLLIKACEKFLRVKEKNSLDDKGSIVLSLIMAYVKQENFSAVIEWLELYKNVKGPKVKGNYKFMRILIDHLIYDKDIYVYDYDFKTEKILYFQLLFIKHLSLHNLDQAQIAWGNLMSVAPSLFTSNYQFSGPKTLFSIALDRYKNLLNMEKNIEDFSELDQISSIADKIQCVLEKRKSITKKELASLIWPGEKAHTCDMKINTYIFQMRKLGFIIAVKEGVILVETTPGKRSA